MHFLFLQEVIFLVLEIHTLSLSQQSRFIHIETKIEPLIYIYGLKYRYEMIGLNPINFLSVPFS